jgi:hypothetical protein
VGGYELLIRLIKVLFGLLLLSSSISELKERYFLFEDRATILISFITVAFLSLLLMHSGIKNKKYNYYFNTRCLLIFVSILLSATVLAYTAEAADKPHIMEFKQHKFSAIFPVQPKMMKLRPKTEKGFLGGYHLSCEVQDYLYIVVYSDYRQDMIDKISKKTFLNNVLKSLSQNFPPKLVNLKDYKIGTRKAYVYDYMLGNHIIGKGVTCLANNRVYNVICAYMGENPNFKKINEFVLSFKITE